MDDNSGAQHHLSGVTREGYELDLEQALSFNYVLNKAHVERARLALGCSRSHVVHCILHGIRLSPTVPTPSAVPSTSTADRAYQSMIANYPRTGNPYAYAWGYLSGAISTATSTDEIQATQAGLDRAIEELSK